MRFRFVLHTTFISLILIVILGACNNNESPRLQGEGINTGEPPTPISLVTSIPTINTADTDILTALPAEIETEQPLEDEAVEAAPPIDHPNLGLMTEYLQDLAANGRFMGSVLVAQDGNILLNEGYGMANIEAGIPNSPGNQYRIGSLTKQFTAAVILKLQEDGLLNVQDPIQKHIPEYPDGDRITIHQLLIHTAGIPNYERRRDLPQIVQTPITLDDLIASFSGQHLDFPPGQQYSYSSSGYVVLTKIIEVVSGQAYSDYIREQIFTPASMNDSGYDYLDPTLRDPAVGYMLTDRGPQPAILTDSSWPTGAGALYSTLGDLYLWDRALYGNDILEQDSLEAMHTPWVDTGQGADYGYGWDIGNTKGIPSIAHGGGIFGFASYIVRFPQDDAVIIVLSNGIQMPPRLVAEELTELLFSDAGS